MFDKVVKIYEYMFAEVSGRKNFEFNPNTQQTKMINNFIKKKESQIGNNWLFRFFLFQFNRYRNQKTRFGRGVVQLGWIVGSKAIEKWDNRTEEQEFVVSEFRMIYELKNPLLPKTKLRLSENYFDIKRKTGDLIQCLELDLYKEKNVVCRICKENKTCKNLK